MSLNLGKYLFASVLLFAGATATAQTTDAGSNPLSNKQNSPYSRYGLGDMRSGANVAYRGLGFATTAIADGFAVNTENPSSYANIGFATYEAAGEGISTTVRANGQSYGAGMATLAYMNVAFPLGKHMGMAIGVKPSSRIYYNIQDSAIGAEGIPGLGDALRIYFGDGSINKAFIGFAGKVKGVSLGANFGYTWGNTRTTSALVIIDDSTTGTNSEVSKYTRIGGIYYNLGAMYEVDLNKKYSLNIGATASLSQNLNAERDEYWISYLGIGGISSYDTVMESVNAKGNITLPLSYGFGAQLRAEKWRVVADYNATQWSQFRNFGNTDSLQASTYRIALGGEITPDAKSRKYFSRVTYRVGGYYGTDHIRLRNTDMNFYAFTLGASLPFKRTPDRIHTGLEIGKRGTQANGLVQENFVKFTLGISLNAFIQSERWFQQRKYD